MNDIYTYIPTRRMEHFRKYTWMTAYQYRDMLMEEACLSGLATSDSLSEIKNLAAQEQARRKALPDQFVECPYCKGWHSEKENNDKLCEKCEWVVHVQRWDITYKNGSKI